jgi:hypothetical protein
MERQVRWQRFTALCLAGLLLLASLLLSACTAQVQVDVNATAVALAHSWATQTAEAQPATPQPPSATSTATLAAPAVTDTLAPTQAPTQAATSTSTLAPSPPLTATATQTAPPKPSSTSTATPKPAATPTVTSTPPVCPVAVDAALASGWDYARLGCPKAPSTIVWSAWQPFEHGDMIWMEDTDWIYALNHAGGTDSKQGQWATGGNGWRWDGITNAPQLTPPEGLVEPIRGFGFVWYYKLGGPTSQVGWGTAEEKGFCALVQRFDKGMLVQSTPAAGCGGGQFNWATTSGFTPVFIALYHDGSWKRF